MSSRILALATATVAVVLTFVGCGGGEPQFDPSTKYSAASLAQEFSFRYQSLDRSLARVAAEPSGGIVSKKGAVTKGGAVTKAAQTNTLDALLDDTITKAATIPGLSQAEACKKVAEQLANDPKISDTDKKAIADKLSKVTN